MLLQRYLDETELAPINKGPALVVEFEGSIEITALHRAIKLLSGRYPVIRGRIVQDDEGFLLHAPPGNYPELTVREGDESDLLAMLRDPWNVENAVFQFLLVQGNACGYLATRFDNSLFDGASIGSVHSALWEIYADVVNGIEAAQVPADLLPAAPLAVMKERWPVHHYERFLPDPVTDETKWWEMPKESVSQARICLSKDETSAIIDRGNKRGASMHGLLCGVLMVAFREQDNTADVVPTACWSAVDLRTRLMPPVGRTDITHCQGAHRAITMLPRNADPVAVGQEVNSRLKRDLESRRVPLVLHIGKMLDPAHLNVAVSSAGVMPDLRCPGGITISNVFAVQHEKTQIPFPILAGFTVNDQLSLALFMQKSLHSIQASELLAEIGARLKSIGGR